MRVPPRRLILLVEHNRILRMLIRDALESTGWEVKEADVVSVRAMLKKREHFDLLLIDNDPSCSGLQLTQHVRKLSHGKKTLLILLSIEDLAAEAREAGANAFLRKPEDLTELVDTVRRLLAAPAAQ